MAIPAIVVYLLLLFWASKISIMLEIPVVAGYIIVLRLAVVWDRQDHEEKLKVEELKK